MKYGILLIVILFGQIAVGQNTPSTNRVYEAKTKFFNEKLQLTKSEADKFWPVYNDYQSRKNRLTKERQVIIEYFNENKANMSDEEIEESLNRFVEINKEMSLLLEEFNNKFKSILPNDKVLQIYIVEVQFREYLIRQLRNKNPEMKPRM